ncbi:unnamed protein product [Caenorhabditis auriculariae]|uniref:Uncharacterized protein n=1 Tax=Caenorhabditis auriculariae TaxID=2777116 RepID=A0A8S1GZX9_9PELO|nr:unnamed protein product [Caenorhabditis auriculariae]
MSLLISSDGPLTSIFPGAAHSVPSLLTPSMFNPMTTSCVTFFLLLFSMSNTVSYSHIYLPYNDMQLVPDLSATAEEEMSRPSSNRRGPKSKQKERVRMSLTASKNRRGGDPDLNDLPAHVSKEQQRVLDHFHYASQAGVSILDQLLPSSSTDKKDSSQPVVSKSSANKDFDAFKMKHKQKEEKERRKRDAEDNVGMTNQMELMANFEANF